MIVFLSPYMKANYMAQDRRVEKTQLQLRQAFIELILQHGYECVSIKELTKNAGVGYNTFFRHFKSKDELLEQLLLNVFIELTPMILETNQIDDVFENEKRLFKYLQKNEDLIRVLFLSCSDVIFKQTKQRFLDGDFDNVGFTKLKANVSPLEYDYIVSQFVQSTLTSIVWWLEHTDQVSIEKMATLNQKSIGHLMHWLDK